MNALILYENLSGHTQIFGEKKAAIQVICYFPVLKSWKMKQGVKFCAHYPWSSHIVEKKIKDKSEVQLFNQLPPYDKDKESWSQGWELQASSV